VLAWFEPRFLLGLTATPERTDGADLLTLCGDNLVHRCDVAEGIRRGLLCPFDYFGVPDEVDYTSIPWRSSHFDEEALTAAVATRTRAQNAFERPDRLVFFVTLDKGTMAAAYGYEDKFLSPTEFQWQSQNRNTQASQLGQKILHSREEGIEVHWFVRDKAEVGGKTQEFRYAGQLEFLRWEGEKPITVWWRLEEAVPEKLGAELGVPARG